ncbi:MAG: type II toxin-antitoxin system HicA family toxin [Acidobacteria bacterium]|nr:type II toxin-antitoxin system HicA family toxin [Acidobacteriota bacterium]
MNSRGLARRCESAGWRRDRQHGSHVAYVKDGAARPIIIPVGKKDLPKHVVSIVLKADRGRRDGRQASTGMRMRFPPTRRGAGGFRSTAITTRDGNDGRGWLLRLDSNQQPSG